MYKKVYLDHNSVENYSETTTLHAHDIFERKNFGKVQILFDDTKKATCSRCYLLTQ